MIIKHKLKMEMAGMKLPTRIEVVQHEQLSRILEISLLQNGIPVPVSDECKIVIQYQKPDGQMCIYDTLDSGEDAWYISGNTIGAILLPDVCDTAGTTILTLKIVEGDEILFTFPVEVMVRENAVIGKKSPGGYLAGFLPQPADAKQGEYLSIAEVDERGRVIRTESVPMEGMAGSEGASAYEIAVRHGFKGTEAEWLASLVGPPGADGITPYVGVSHGTTLDGRKNVTIYVETEMGDGTSQIMSESVTDGFSPVALSTPIDGGTRVTIHGENQSTSFDVMNGTPGEKGDKGDTGAIGPKGDSGKSAYAYAVESGYTGTEEEFADKLAEEAPKAFYVTVTNNGDGTGTMDKTYEEITNAIEAGGTAIVMVKSADGDSVEGASLLATYDGFYVATFVTVNTSMFAVVIYTEGCSILEIPMVSSVNGETGDISIVIPTTMKNPCALTINNKTYDGSFNVDITSDVNSLIDTKLSSITNAEEVAF